MTTGADAAEVIAAAVLAHPAVVRLDGGPFTTYLPGRRVAGVRTGDDGVEIAVVLRLGRLTETSAQLRALVREIAGDVRVDVVITDVSEDPASPERS